MRELMSKMAVLACRFWSNLEPWLIARMNEKSTWAALLVSSSTLLGVTIDPAKQEAITSMGMMFAAAIAIATKESK